MDRTGLGVHGTAQGPRGVAQGQNGVTQGPQGAVRGGDPNAVRPMGSAPLAAAPHPGLDIGTLAGLAAVLPGLFQQAQQQQLQGGGGHQKPGMQAPSIGGAGGAPMAQNPKQNPAGGNRTGGPILGPGR